MSANPVVDPAQLERLRRVPACRSCEDDPGTAADHPECDACLTLLCAAVEEQTIERYEAAYSELLDSPGLRHALRSLPRQWSSMPEEAR